MGSIELQLIDCNCNDCSFMQRDFERFNYYKEWHRALDFADFERRKKKAIEDAKAMPDGPEREGMLRVAYKMKFQFEYINPVHYGHCTKLETPVSFLVGICQPETQYCFEHRRLAPTQPWPPRIASSRTATPPCSASSAASSQRCGLCCGDQVDGKMI